MTHTHTHTHTHNDYHTGMPPGLRPPRHNNLFAKRKGLVTLKVMCNNELLGVVDVVNKPHVYVVRYQLRVNNVLPANSLGSNNQMQ